MDTESTGRNPLFAALFSIFTPGLGQMYNGQLIKGILFFIGLFVLTFIYGVVLQLQYSYSGIIAIVIIELVSRIGVFIDAIVFGAIQRKNFVPKVYNRIPYYIIAAVLMLGIGIFFSVQKWDMLKIRAFVNPTESMMPSLHLGDHVIVDWKFSGTESIEAGDIVVLSRLDTLTYNFLGEPDPGTPEHPTFLIKRVVGVPGQTVAYKDHTLWINGKAVQMTEVEKNKIHRKQGYQLSDETYTIYEEKLPGNIKYFIQHIDPDSMNNLPPIKEMEPTYLKEGCYFLLGDNRDISLDGRYFGCIQKANIYGKVMFIYASHVPERIGKTVK